jgi:hypothetical protein
LEVVCSFFKKGTREMNANELADELLYRYADEGGNFYGDDIHKDVIEMLRQQALEIQALHQILGYEGIEVGKEYLDECVADLRKAQE